MRELIGDWKATTSFVNPAKVSRQVDIPSNPDRVHVSVFEASELENKAPESVSKASSFLESTPKLQSNPFDTTYSAFPSLSDFSSNPNALFQKTNPPIALEKEFFEAPQNSMSYAIADDDTDQMGGEDEDITTSFDDIKVTPLVTLAKVTVSTGEENEEVSFSGRVKLYRMVKGEWKDRGCGEMKLLHNKTTGSKRVIMRRDQTHKMCCNHYLYPGMKLMPHGDQGKNWIWKTVGDFSDEFTQAETFLVRFKDTTIAGSFKKCFEDFTTLEEKKKNVTMVDSVVELYSGKASLYVVDPIEHDKLLKAKGTIHIVNDSGIVKVTMTDEGNVLISCHNMSSVIDVSSDLQDDTKICYSATTSSGSETVNSYVVAFADGKEAQLFVQAMKKESILVKKEDIDVVFLREELPSDELVRKAESFMLPKSFYNYLIKPPCPGCIGCNEAEDIGVPFTVAVSTTDASSLLAEHIAKPSISKLTSSGLTTTANFGFTTSSSGFLSFSDLSATQSAEFEKANPKFSFRGAGQKLFQVSRPIMVDDDSDQKGGENDDNTTSFDDIKVTPLVTLAKVTVSTGEENEEVSFSGRVKLYRMVKGEWKDRGCGEMKLLHNKTTGSKRVIMRRDQTHKMCCNHYLYPGMKLMPHGDQGKNWIWKTVGDFSDEFTQAETFLVRFKDTTIAGSFKKCFEDFTTLEEKKKNVTMVDSVVELYSGKASLYVVDPIEHDKLLKAKGTIHIVNDSGIVKVTMTDEGNVLISCHNMSSVIDVSSDLQDDTKICYSATTSSGSETVNSYVVAFADGKEAQLFVQAMKKESILVKKEDIDVVFLREELPSDELVRKAESFMLPKSFYNYLIKPPCPGCIGCNEAEDIGVPFTVAVSTTDASSLLAEHIAKPSISKLTSSGLTTTANFGFTTSSSGFLSFSDLSATQSAEFEKANPKFSFRGAGQKLFQVSRPIMVDDDSDQKGGENDDNTTSFDDIKVTPLVTLAKVTVSTGEENEEVSFSGRVKLYRMVKGEWKDRGCGEMKLLHNKTTGSKRVIMRRDQTHKMCCNHYLYPGMKLMPHGDQGKNWIWKTVGDFSDEFTQAETFLVRFKDTTIAGSFKKCFEDFTTLEEKKKNVTMVDSVVELYSGKASLYVVDPIEHDKLLKAKGTIHIVNDSGIVKVTMTDEGNVLISCHNMSSVIDVSSDLQDDTKICYSATTSSGSETVNSYVVAFADGKEAQLFVQAMKKESILVKKEDIDVVFLREELPSDELVRKAESFMLPKSFYNYLIKPPCPGCIGCNEAEDIGVPFTVAVSTTDASSLLAEHIAKPSISKLTSSGLTTTANFGFTTSSSGFLSFSDLSATQSAEFEKANPKFSFRGAGQKLFQVSRPIMVDDDSDQKGGENDDNTTSFDDIKVTPLVTLAKVTVSTGEENEEVSFSGRVKLYRMVKGEWKDRGCGEMKLLHNKTTGSKRVIMRRDQTHKMCCNHYLYPGMKLMPHGDQGKNWIWKTVGDFSDEFTQAETFLVRFKDTTIAGSFKKCFEDFTTLEEKKKNVTMVDSVVELYSGKASLYVVDPIEHDKRLKAKGTIHIVNDSGIVKVTMTGDANTLFFSNIINVTVDLQDETKVFWDANLDLSSSRVHLAAIFIDRDQASLFVETMGRKAEKTLRNDISLCEVTEMPDTNQCHQQLEFKFRIPDSPIKQIEDNDEVVSDDKDTDNCSESSMPGLLED